MQVMTNETLALMKAQFLMRTFEAQVQVCRPDGVFVPKTVSIIEADSWADANAQFRALPMPAYGPLILWEIIWDEDEKEFSRWHAGTRNPA